MKRLLTLLLLAIMLCVANPMKADSPEPNPLGESIKTVTDGTVVITKSSGTTTLNATDFTSSTISGYNDATEIAISGNWDTYQLNRLILSVRNETLTKVDMSGLTATGSVDMEGWFSLCSALAEVLMPTAGIEVSNFRETFTGCNIQSLDLSNVTVTAGINMNVAFGQCAALKKIKMPSATITVSNLSSAFYLCTKLEKVDLSHIVSPAGGIDLSYIFSSCSSLTSVEMPSATITVTDINSAFSECNKLQNIDLSRIVSPTGLDMTQSFFNCTSLTSVYLPSATSPTNTSTSFDATNPNCIKIMPKGSTAVYDAGWTNVVATTDVIDDPQSGTYNAVSLTNIALDTQYPFSSP
ncbi:MAG: leucine-rich repeat domain-containing protein, partial [Muribaculaceae bacterium]|nr:leucine-rich repeat domain-containing protein [Muribaculaceae bacterium]